jgi:hypothetical protein
MQTQTNLLVGFLSVWLSSSKCSGYFVPRLALVESDLYVLLYTNCGSYVHRFRAPPMNDSEFPAGHIIALVPCIDPSTVSLIGSAYHHMNFTPGFSLPEQFFGPFSSPHGTPLRILKCLQVLGIFHPHGAFDGHVQFSSEPFSGIQPSNKLERRHRAASAHLGNFPPQSQESHR